MITKLQDYKITKLFIVIAIVIVFVTGCSSSSQVLKIKTDEAVHQFKVEVVTTEEDKRQGLMGRESLSEDRGMLFVYDEEGNQSFWMKNMLIPLDILFIASDLVITHISENVPPCVVLDNDCINYSSLKPTQYILELSAGVSDELNIDVGDMVILVQ